MKTLRTRAFPILCALSVATPSARAFQGPFLEMRCETRELLPDDGDLGDHFGWDVAISGDTFLVGAPKNDSSGSAGPGAAYLFDFATGSQLEKLVATDGVFQDHFGFSVDLDGTRAIVGAPSHDLDLVFTANPGAAYLFDTTTGVQLAKLLSDDIDAGDMFGTAVAIQGNLALVGAPGDSDNGLASGSAYLFDVTTGEQIFKLVAPDGGEEDVFGSAVALDGDRAVVGAPQVFFFSKGPGAAYLFDTTTGQLLTQLAAGDGELGDLFGAAVAIAGDTVLVGASREDDSGVNAGAAYLFTTAGAQLAKLLPGAVAPSSLFGEAVALEGGTAVVGAWVGNSLYSDSGTVHLFDVATAELEGKLYPSDAFSGDHFGHGVAIAGNRVVVGAQSDRDEGTESGSAYTFELLPTPVREFCHGAGCPCGNDYSEGGCQYGFGPNGTKLTVCGSASVTADDMIFRASPISSTWSPSAILFVGDAVTSMPFFDGRLCVTGNVFRINPPQPVLVGQAQFTGVVATACGLFDQGACITAGSTRYFQTWYRDPAGACGPSNLTNAVEITFGP